MSIGLMLVTHVQETCTRFFCIKFWCTLDAGSCTKKAFTSLGGIQLRCIQYKKLIQEQNAEKSMPDNTCNVSRASLLSVTVSRV